MCQEVIQPKYYYKASEVSVEFVILSRSEGSLFRERAILRCGSG